MDFLGYLGDRAKRRVFGRWKETVVRTFRLVVEWAPTRAAFLAFLALVSFEGVLVAVFPLVDFEVAILMQP